MLRNLGRWVEVIQEVGEGATFMRHQSIKVNCSEGPNKYC